MSNIIDLDEHKEVLTNTTVSCKLCDKKWVGTHHKDTFALECPECHSMNPIRKPIGYGEIFASLAWAIERLLSKIADRLTKGCY